jgi:hypothetical protein
MSLERPACRYNQGPAFYSCALIRSHLKPRVLAATLQYSRFTLGLDYIETKGSETKDFATGVLEA